VRLRITPRPIPSAAKSFLRSATRTDGASPSSDNGSQAYTGIPQELHARPSARRDRHQRPLEAPVYAIGKGRVHLVFREFPHLTVAVEHTLPDGSVLYSMYVHVMDVKVAVGDEVDETTVLACLFDAEELAKADFATANHLHFEIRSSLDDGGWASASSMTLEALDRCCRDPLAFFRRHLR
jgi:murein DD-endopeptidase MepM/ murein hydrolase activator NlpD